MRLECLECGAIQLAKRVDALIDGASAVAGHLAGEGLAEQAGASLDRYAAVAGEVEGEQVREALLAIGEALRARL